MVAVVRERGDVAYEGGLSLLSKGRLLELHKQEEKVAPSGCGHCGACSCAAHRFCISGSQDHYDLPAAAGLLIRNRGIKKMSLGK